MRPNFLIIIVDQMNSFSLGWNGNAEVQTPHLDQLCQEGVSFSRAYPTNPVCQPSRASLHTGLTPRQHGLTTNGCNLDERIPTLTGTLAAHDYRTHCVGKIHLQPFSTDAKDASGQPATWERPRSLERRRNHGLAPAFLRVPERGLRRRTCALCPMAIMSMMWEAQRPGTKAELSREKAYYSLPGSQSWRMEIPPEWHYNDWITRKSIDFLRDVGEDNFFLVTLVSGSASSLLCHPALQRDVRSRPGDLAGQLGEPGGTLWFSGTV